MSTQRALILSIHDTPDGRVLATSGSLDIATVAKFEEAADALIAAGDSVIADLSDLLVCDSTGLGCLVRVHRRAAAAGTKLAVRSPRPHIADLLAMSGISKVIEVLPSPR